MTLFMKKKNMAVNQLCESEKLNGNKKSIKVYCTHTLTYLYNAANAANAAMTAQILHNFRFSSRMSSAYIFWDEPIQWPMVIVHMYCTYTHLHLWRSHTIPIDLREFSVLSGIYIMVGTASGIFKTHSFASRFLFIFACCVCVCPLYSCGRRIVTI